MNPPTVLLVGDAAAFEDQINDHLPEGWQVQIAHSRREATGHADVRIAVIGHCPATGQLQLNQLPTMIRRRPDADVIVLSIGPPGSHCLSGSDFHGPEGDVREHLRELLEEARDRGALTRSVPAV